MLRSIVLLMGLMLVIVGCVDNAASNQSADEDSDPAAEVIERYLKARVDSDEDALRENACADWESQVTLEANSFRGRDAQLEDMSCATRESAGGEGVVECEGVILASYQGEQSEFELGNYRVVEEDGVWKMCGEAE